MDKLKRSDRFPEPGGPVVEIIMDGVGVAPEGPGNAVVEARTPTLDWLIANNPQTVVAAHGVAAGLPSDDDMGNSEVGHNALGGGRIFDQGAKLVNKAIETGSLFDGDVWKAIVERSKARRSALHLIGLLSDGNVHSHIDQLLALVEGAARDGITTLRIHILTDGRDVGERTALTYIERVEESLARLRGNGLDYLIASGGGRMIVTMDRYEADWGIVERGWKAHVQGEARHFPSASAAVQTLYDDDKDVNDQFLPAFVVVGDDDRPVGKMKDGDSVVFFNFRGDRAIEITRAFEDEEFDKFDRGAPLDLFYAGMMQYDGDLMLPKKYLVAPPAISQSLGEYLAITGVTQFATAETQKYGHVTYFWNGNRSGKFSDQLETYVEVPSDKVPFEQRPWMKAGEVTDEVLKAIASGEFQFIRVNYANGDMVGHTGHYGATMIAVEAVDLALERVLRGVQDANGVLVVTADHGNSDDMYMKKKGEIQVDAEGKPVPKTSHSLNPVPFVVYDPRERYVMADSTDKPGLGNNASTIINLLGYEAPGIYLPSLVAPR
ncbi:MAG: 2,3-bisphosphoglycerate-independent phosphoglycerate mutase [Acidobacteria bacterium]|jgi:2,3-bisphosphoglycerate-independent phosphoglycerate mutase|nr:2,3-bisphosphoglycerate-independent phosphoglycerate mutase [Acidobacteriota bacterium]